MENEIETTIKESARNLPSDLKDYVLGDVWPKQIDSLRQINKLNDEQYNALKAEVFLVLVGIENYSDFRSNVQKNVHGIESQDLYTITAYVDKNIFENVKIFLVEVEQINNSEETENSPDKETILHGIENPTPARPILPNPAGSNLILDAQRELPEQEKKILIGSNAVPSRGPMLGNFKSNFNSPPLPDTKKYEVDPYREPAE